MSQWIFDKKNLAMFYVAIVLYSNIVIRLINEGLSFTIGNSFLFIMCFIWSIIQLIDDIAHKRVFDSKLKILFAIYYVFTAAIFLLNRPYNIDAIRHNVFFVLMWYTVMSVGQYESKEDMKKILLILSKHIIAITVILNVVSIGAFILLKLGVVKTLPSLFFYSQGGHHTDTSFFAALINGRYGGLYPYLLFAGIFSYLSTVLSFYLFENGLIGRISVLMITILGLIMTALSNPRTVELIYIFILLSYIYKKITKQNIKKLYLLSIAVLIVIGIFLVFVHYDVMHMNSEEAFQFFNHLTSLRWSYWKVGIESFLERKWIGYGFGNLGHLPWEKLHYHNIIMSNLVWGGIIGFLLILFIVL